MFSIDKVLVPVSLSADSQDTVSSECEARRVRSVNSKMAACICPPPLPLEMLGTEGLVSEEPALYRRPIPDHEWRRIAALLRVSVSRLDQRVILPLRDQITERIQWLDGYMTRYCELTCPSCEDPCCGGRMVFYNRTDLLLSTLSASDTYPPGQTRERPDHSCRYLEQDGCRLSRTVRPYVCVWFLCDAQMDLLQDEPALFQRHFVRVLGEIRTLRLRLETLYLRHSFPDEEDPKPLEQTICSIRSSK
jgi:hypothetical protein